MPVVYSSIFSTLLTTFLNVYAIVYNKGLIAIAFFSTFGILSEFLILLFFSKRFVLSTYRFDFKEFISTSCQLLVKSTPIVFSGFALLIQARVDQLMLAFLLGDASVGFYSAALKIPESLTFIATALATIHYPKFTRSDSINNKLMIDNKEYFQYANISISIGLIISTAIGLTAPLSIPFLFGSDFAPSIPILIVMSLRLLLAHYGIVRGAFLLNEGLLSHGTLTMFIGTIVNVLLNFTLIPRWAGLGASIATVLSLLITIFIIDLCFKSTRQYALKLLNPNLILPPLSIIRNLWA